MRDTTPLRKQRGRSRQRNDALGRGRIAPRGNDDVLEVRLAVKIADDVSPFARRGERDRARTLANGKAFDGFKRNIGLRRETLAERLEHPGPHWARPQICR